MQAARLLAAPAKELMMEAAEREQMVRGGFVAALGAAVALPLLMGALTGEPDLVPGRTWASGGLSGLAQRPLPPDAMPLTVRLTSIVSSSSAEVGQPWTGIVVRPLELARGVIPAGTPVRGVVTAASEAGPDRGATLELAVQDVTLGGRTRRLSAMTGPFIRGRSGATRPRYLARIGGHDDEVVLKPRTVMVFALDQRLAAR